MVFQLLNNYHLVANRWLQPYLNGTVSMSSGSTTVTGTNTDFLTGTHKIKVGDTITISGAGNSTSGVSLDTDNYDTTDLVAKVTAITSETSLTVDMHLQVSVTNVKLSNVNFK